MDDKLIIRNGKFLTLG